MVLCPKVSCCPKFLVVLTGADSQKGGGETTEELAATGNKGVVTTTPNLRTFTTAAGISESTSGGPGADTATATTGVSNDVDRINYQLPSGPWVGLFE